jgi:hypothetical protein
MPGVDVNAVVGAAGRHLDALIERAERDFLASLQRHGAPLADFDAVRRRYRADLLRARSRTLAQLRIWLALHAANVPPTVH